MKRTILFIAILFIGLILIGCNKEEVITPEDRLKEYVDHWNSGDYESMYQMLANDVSQEDFVDRYEKIYGDLDVEELEVTYSSQETNEDEEVNWDEVESMVFPLSVSMTTLAGPVEFQREMTVVKEMKTVEDEEVMDWAIEWDAGFIFPQLENEGTIRIKTTEPNRGQIFDRNGNGLAENGDVYEMSVVPERFTENEEEEKEQVAEVLGITVEEIETALSASWVEPHHVVPLKVVPTIHDNGLEEAVNEIPPLTYQMKTGRVYPLGEKAAHLVGYIAPMNADKWEEVDQSIYSENDLIGYRGLEQLYEEDLRGESGVQIIAESEGQEPAIIAEKEVQHGKDITLTIDIQVQARLFDELDGEAGTAAALHPQTGEALALVSSPSFDPSAFLYGLSADQWQEWQDDPNNPLLNRFASTYAPGSAFKPITSAIGLNNGSIDPQEELAISGLTWSKEGWGNYEVRRVSESSSGKVDLTDALVRSDNIYFAQQALKMGAEPFIEGLQSFGFEEDFPFTYPIAKSTISSDGDLSEEVLLANTSYGQGEIEMSVLHLATAFTPFLNEGNMLKPTLLMDEEKGETWKESLITSEQVAIINDALRKVVTNGTGSNANISNVTIAGKTGTAELKLTKEEKDGQENGWFVGYTEDASMLVAMMVERIEGQSGGSGYVAEKVGNVIADVAQ
ncbi:penicillin-binding protein [Gracilibacillus halotolerans]|uniref:serine-type D-Ala-D-Ala carboxypeptidase n=1 Tax=Gracilibacillus halotolerans TaxID=74386 RepID=A0A841RE46_9BACI|nr:penicillin-binding transpeptidase domain-containing protein [Gracilibacillus halotolerans]MBB6512270.1 penicillin-binding protein [Gracilibacillus halotolerans]